MKPFVKIDGKLIPYAEAKRVLRKKHKNHKFGMSIKKHGLSQPSELAWISN